MRALASLLLCSACSVPARVWLDVPGDVDAKSILFAAGEPLRVFAYPLEAGGAISPPLVLEDETGQVEAALFADDLATLQLGAGELERGSGSTVGDLPNRLGVYRANQMGRTFSEWETVELLSDEVEGYPIAAPKSDKSCGTLEASRLFLPTVERALFMVPLPDAVLLGTNDGRLFRVWEEGFEELAIGGPRVLLRSGATDALGRLWFVSTATPTSTLWSGTIDGVELALEPVATATDSLMSRIAVSRADPLEIVAIDRRGNMFRYDGTELALVRPTDDPNANTKITDLVVVEPGHVVGIHSDFRLLFRYRDGAATVEGTPGEDQPRGLEMVPGFGVVVAMVSDLVFLVTDEWTRLGTTSVIPPVDVVTIPTGFLIGSDLGAVEEYAVGVGFCRDGVLPSQGEATVIGAPLHDGAAYVNGYNRGADDGPLPVVFVRRRFSR